MKYTPLMLVVLLSGCSLFQTKPDIPKQQVVPEVATKLEYVIKIPPKELVTLPDQVPAIDVDAAKQSDIAAWVIASEKRTQQLENMLIGIANFFKTEQAKLDDAAAQTNAKAAVAASKAQLDAAKVSTDQVK